MDSVRDKVRSSVISERLSGPTAVEVVGASGEDACRPPPGGGVPVHPAGRRPQGSRWRCYISSVAWERLRVHQSELVSVAGRGKSGLTGGSAAPRI